MGVLTQIEAIGGSVASGLRGLSSLATTLTGGSWQQSLRIASLGGVPFAVESATTSGGRQSVVHVYPFRDEVWVEDMGKLPRRFQIYGFLIEGSSIYGGGGVVGQRDRFLRVVEAKPGESTEAINGLTLVHPTLGTIRDVSCLGPVEFLEQADSGRVLRFRITLLQGGPRLFPTATASTPDVTEAAAKSLFEDALDNFIAAMQLVRDVASAITQAIATAQRWIGIARSALNDVRSIGALLANLKGNFGRFSTSAGRSRGPLKAAAVSVTPSLRLSESAEARAATIGAGDRLLTAARRGNDPAAFANAGLQQVQTLAATATDPADRIRILSPLAAFRPDDPMPSGVLGAAMQMAQAACSAVLRRCALVEIARATAAYQPASSDEAVALRDLVAALLDSEITLAGDTGDDASYEALRRVREAVINDLNARGSGLASVRDISLNTELPALVLSNQLYRTAARSDELVDQANPVHPAFMPARFRALSSGSK